MSDPQSRIRNFCVIAHVDHGKTTLSDRLIELTKTVPLRQMKEQMLDSMELEREHGVTIKARAVRMAWPGRDGQIYELNLIDTPGHVDFNYEVSRSLAACEGAILLVDASQGVQAQTVANAYLAMENDLTIRPVLNKIDMPMARPDEAIAEMEHAVGVSAGEVIRVSAKAGLGIDELFKAIIERIPPPPGDPKAPLTALVYNSHFDTFKGVVVYVRVMDGVLRKGQRIRLMRGATEHEVAELGQLRPAPTVCNELSAGQVGYFMAQIKNIADVHLGATVTDAANPTDTPLTGYKEPKPMVFSGLYPVENRSEER